MVGDDQIERHVPSCSVLLRRGSRDVGTGDELQNFGKFEAPVGYHPGVFLLVGRKSINPLLSSGGRSILDKSSEELSAGDGHDVDIVAEDGEASGRNRERNLSEGGAERFNADDGVLFIVKAGGA